jgi:two-component system chemotaxis response regulator CheY
LKKVLVVDDAEIIRKEVSRVLTPAGFVVLEGTDGLAGLELARANTDLSLIVLDVNMPVMGGLDMLDRLVGDVRTVGIPVLFLTTEGQEALMARAKKAGARGWLVKPVKPDVLLKAVKQLARSS